jgi:hypothetical protein
MQSALKMFQTQLENMQKGDDSVAKPTKLHESFKLPICYLDKSQTHELSPIVSSDLELMTTQSDSKPMYNTLFKPSHQFAQNMIPEWNTHFTDNVAYLKDTQKIIESMDVFHANVNPLSIGIC